MPYRRLIALLFIGLGMLPLSSAFAQGLQHFESCPQNTNNLNNAQLFLPADFRPALSEGDTLEAGDEIALFTEDGICAGAIRWEGAQESITVYGEDEQFGYEGYAEGDSLSMRVWDASAEATYDVETTYQTCDSGSSPICQDDGQYHTDSFATVADVTTAADQPVGHTPFGNAPDEPFVLEPAAPNPFATRTSFRMMVAQQQPVRVAVYNVLGQRVALLHDGSLAADTPHRFTFAAQGHPAGMYIIRATGSSFQATRKVTLAR